MVTSVVFFYYLYWFASESFLEWLFYDPIGQFTLLLIHPIVHANSSHLLGNMIFGIAILGTLIESWMVMLSRRKRYGILLSCYLVSLGPSALIWLSPKIHSAPAIGSSGLIFAGLAFALYYCMAYFKRKWLKSLNLLALVGIVIVSAFLAVPIILSPYVRGGFLVGPSPFLHLMCFLISLVLATLLFDRIYLDKRLPSH
jgi:membrane associated rhomboid family serine protease